MAIGRDSEDNKQSPMAVPAVLKDLAGWTWRVLLLAAAAYLLVQFLDIMHLIVLPIVAALFATALAHPIVAYFRRYMPRAVATWLTVLLAGVVIAGVFILVVNRASSEYPELNQDLQNATKSVTHFLKVDLHIKSGAVNNLQDKITSYLGKHQTAILSSSVTVLDTTGKVLTAVVLWLFTTFFLMYDGENIWAWIVGLFPPSGQHRMRGAGDKAWARLAGFVRGTFIIALFHAVVAGVSLAALRVPLVLPLALLVFIGSFLPIVGALIVGVLAVILTFATRGTVPGIVLIGILLIDNQIETHVLQPFLVGRYVRLHPLVVAISITGGAVLEGLPGAILAVPVVAVVYAAIRYLVVGDEDESANDEIVPGEDKTAPTAEHKLVPEVD